jgi:hypothetical protein
MSVPVILPPHPSRSRRVLLGSAILLAGVTTACGSAGIAPTSVVPGTAEQSAAEKSSVDQSVGEPFASGQSAANRAQGVPDLAEPIAPPDDADRLPPVEPSAPHGFFDQPFSVTLTVESPAAAIRYTTDGSPPTADSGLVYTGAIPITTTTVLRAAAFADGTNPSRVTTQSYIFPDAASRQPADPPGFPTTWADESAVYAVDAGAAEGAGIGGGNAAVRAALLSLPTLSIALDGADLFGAARGIYAHPEARGPDWERPASAEWIVPGGIAEEGEQPFQVDAGLQIQGHWNRLPEKTPKHSLRLVFKKQYGPGQLEHRLFPRSDVDAFNTLTLRGGFNDSWLVDVPGQRERALYIRDEWARATQRAMGWPAPHGRFVHLWLNGLYWGLYNVVERPDEAFAADTLGGEREDYDVLQHGELIAGKSEDWHAMLGIARAGMASPESYAAIQDYLDVANLIDYMLLYLYTADDDWPKRNWYAARQRAPGAGWRFFTWDGERGLEDPELDVVEVHGGDNPTLPYHHLRIDNPEFRLRFADHVQRHLLSPGGALYVCSGKPAWDPASPGCNIPAARFMRLAGAIEPALPAETARWGSYRKPEQPFSRDREWRAEQDRLLAEYFPVRSRVLLDQLRRVGLYPTLDAPSIAVDPDRRLVHLYGRSGEVYFTTDGSDPRVPGTGAVAAGARRASDSEPVPLAETGTTLVKARARDGGTWSALVEAADGVPDLRISEIMYHPSDDGHEFVELANRGQAVAPLYDPAVPGGSWRLAGGVRYRFPYGTLIPPGGRLVIVGGIAPSDFRAKYGVDPAVQILGPFAGKLDNAGDRVALERPLAQIWGATADSEVEQAALLELADGPAYKTVDEVAYEDDNPWPKAADGDGPSLERVAPGASGNAAASWAAGAVGGTPGR